MEGRAVARHKKRAADLGAWLCFEDEAGQGLRPPKGRTWSHRGHTPVVRVTAAGTKRVSMAALICTKAGRRPRLIYRIHLDRGPVRGRRKGFIETDADAPRLRQHLTERLLIPRTAVSSGDPALRVVDLRELLEALPDRTRHGRRSPPSALPHGMRWTHLLIPHRLKDFLYPPTGEDDDLLSG